MDYSAFAAVSAVLLLTALLACFLPARRAASVERCMLNLSSS